MTRDREAEGSGGQEGGREESELTIEELRYRREALAQKVSAAAAKREEDIRAKMTEREALRAEEVRLAPLIAEARGTLDYYQTQKDLGALDPQDEEELERLKLLVETLEEQWEQAKDRSERIMSNPEISGRVYDEALAEDQKRGFEKDNKKAQEKSEGKIKALFDKVKEFSAIQESFERDFDSNSRKLSESRVVLEKSRDKALGVLAPNKHQETISVLQNFWQGTEPVKFLEALREHRRNLGMWAGKEKAAIDSLLAKSGEFDLAQQLWKSQGEPARLRDKMQKEFRDLAEEYRDIFRDAWKDQSRMMEKYPGAKPDLPARIWHNQTTSVLERFADVERREDGAKVGRYKDRKDAYRNNPGLERIAENWSRLQDRGGIDYEVVLSPPEKWKQKS